MYSNTKQSGPTSHDVHFHHDKPEYAENSIAKGLASGNLTEEDAKIIRQFVAEQRGIRGICNNRANKMTFNLVCRRKHIGPFRQNTISDLYEGITKMRSSKVRGHTIKQNTTYDYIRFLKRFYLWMIENEYSTLLPKKIKEIKTPQIDRMTKTASQMLTEEEIAAILAACISSRDRAIIATMWDSGVRIHVKFLTAASTW